MLKVSHLCFEYADHPLLRDLNFAVESGQLLHIKGQNGAGKSTLLKLLATLLSPSSGEILFDDTPLSQCVHEYRANMCYIGHLDAVHPLLTPKEVWRYDLPHTKNTPSLSSVLALLNLESVSDTSFAYLSAGQKKRVGMMRLIMRASLDIWLLDEPWVSLDVDGVEQLKLLILRHLEQGGCVITTAHQSLPFASSLVREYCL